jgi:hypothetical protein
MRSVRLPHGYVSDILPAARPRYCARKCVLHAKMLPVMLACLLDAACRIPTHYRHCTCALHRCAQALSRRLQTVRTLATLAPPNLALEW